MSHGVTAAPCNPLKQEGNSCDTVRHGGGSLKSQKPLILLAIPAGLEPATHGVEIRYLTGVSTVQNRRSSFQLGARAALFLGRIKRENQPRSGEGSFGGSTTGVTELARPKKNRFVRHCLFKLNGFSGSIQVR